MSRGDEPDAFNDSQLFFSIGRYYDAAIQTGGGLEYISLYRNNIKVNFTKWRQAAKPLAPLLRREDLRAFL